MWHLDVLSRNQRAVLASLRLPASFYLAGGTALALQIGHRTSVDFDFYAKDHFETPDLIKDLQKSLPEIRIIFQAEDTLGVAAGETELSFFYYGYPLIRQTANFEGRLKVAAKEDIAAMKLAAIVQRGTKRDFIDIFFLLKDYSLEKLLSFALRKYKGYQKMLILRALIYFADADIEKYPRLITVLDKNFSWEKAKAKIFEEVRKYQLSMFRK